MKCLGWNKDKTIAGVERRIGRWKELGINDYEEQIRSKIRRKIIFNSIRLSKSNRCFLSKE